jgi:glycerophosphoryl diester phosphodiesterase
MNIDQKRNKPRRRRGLGCLLALIGIPVVYYGAYLLLRGPLPAEPQFIAHRGGRVGPPENTLAAFQNAVDLGADWLEMDVQRTRDGELVVIHDETVDRTTNGSGRVADLTFDQIRALDAGLGQQVPTFAEVIAFAKDQGVGILPEAKSPLLYPGIEQDMVEALQEDGYTQQTVVQSFVPETLERFLQIDPDQQVCPLTGLWVLDLSDPQPAGSAVLCPMAEMVVLNPWMVRQAHAAGRQVYIWFGVIEHPLTMRILLAFGADGLMVDDPAALAEVLGR